MQGINDLSSRPFVILDYIFNTSKNYFHPKAQWGVMKGTTAEHPSKRSDRLMDLFRLLQCHLHLCVCVCLFSRVAQVE